MALEDENKSAGLEGSVPVVDPAAGTPFADTFAENVSPAPQMPADSIQPGDFAMPTENVIGGERPFNAFDLAAGPVNNEPVTEPEKEGNTFSAGAEPGNEEPVFTGKSVDEQRQENEFVSQQTGSFGSQPDSNPPLQADPFGTPVDPFVQSNAGSQYDSGPVMSEPVDNQAMGTVITVSGTAYAASVFWQPLQNPDNPLLEIRETVANVLPEADLYVLRPSGVPQYGLSVSAQGHKAGMPVAALAALNAFQDTPSAVGVFKVPEGWWFIAIRNDLILAEEDVLYTNEEDAKRNFLSMMAVPDWGRKIAPTEWAIEGAEEMDIATFFADAPKIKLVKLKKELSVKTVAIAVLVIVVLGLTVFTLFSKMFQTAEVIQEVVAPPPPVVKPVVEKPKVVKVPMPWESLIVPSEFIKVCASSINVLTASVIPGWTMSDVRCQASGLSTSWSMQWGRVGNFLTIMKKYNIDGLHYTVAKGGRSATGTIQFNQLRRAASEPTMTSQQIMDELTDIFQAIAMPVQLSITDVKPTANVKPRGKSRTAAKNTAPVSMPATPSYSYVNFSFSSPLPISEWNYFFDKFGALELTSLLYNKASNNWKYEGRIYGKKN